VRRLLSAGYVCMLLAGCVSGEGQFQWRYYEHYSVAQKNRQALANLRPGMSQEEVRTVMGEPEMVEAYPREAVWFYRTATSDVVEGSQEADFTPLFFDERQRLRRWGRTASTPWPLRPDPTRTLP
jgi:outer membrane protein assembly factor BamE (lipoprotein component of BamABCDE complex)